MSTIYFSKTHANARLPTYKTTHAAGMDVYPLKGFFVNPGATIVVETGVKLRIPEGCYGRLAPRSSLSLKGLSVEAGVIDRDYSDELKVMVSNRSSVPFAVDLTKDPDFRICQLIFERIDRPESIQEVSELPDVDTNRTGGFGSTDRDHSEDDKENEMHLHETILN